MRAFSALCAKLSPGITTVTTLLVATFSSSPFTQAHASAEFNLPIELETAVSQEAYLEAKHSAAPDHETESSTAFDWNSHFKSTTQTWGVKLGSPASFVKNVDVALKPASNTKLFTAALALDRLGPTHQFETKLAYKTTLKDKSVAVNLNIIGSGNPTPTFPFAEWAEAMKARGVKTVVGPIVTSARDTRWNQVDYPPGWDLKTDPYVCFGALPRALNLDYNCATYVLTSTTKGYFVDPDVQDKVLLDFKTAKVTDIEVMLEATPGAATRPTLKLTGTITNKFPKRYALPIMQPEKWFAAKLKSALIQAGIKVVEQSAATKAKLSGGKRSATPLVSLSPPLSEILVPFLKSSINLIGESLFLSMGEATPAPTSLLTAGQNTMTNFLRTRGLTQSIFYDGSGVSHDNRVTAFEVYQLLEDIQASTNFSVVWNALPIAGVDGTLKYRMRGEKATNFLRAKTGTLTGVSNLAGYVPVLDGKGFTQGYIPFVMLSSPLDFTAEMTELEAEKVESSARRVQDLAGIELVKASLASTKKSSSR